MLLIKAASVFYPSQSIGNSTTDEALVLMRQLYAHCTGQVAVLSAHRDVTGNPTRPGALCFSAGGTLRTENSVKYWAQTFTAPVHRPGFTQIRQLTDARECVGLFAADA